LPHAGDGWSIHEILAGAPAAGVDGKDSVNEDAELWDLIWAACELVVAKPGTVEESVQGGYAEVPWFDDVICCCEGGYGLAEFFEVGWFW
jgi:hypothetical protein